MGSELVAYQYDDEECQIVRKSHAALLAAYPERMAAIDLRGTLEAIVSFITDVNTFAERTKPWELKKDEAKRDQLTAVLHHMCEACALASVLLQPFVPAAAAKMQAQLNAIPTRGPQAQRPQVGPSSRRPDHQQAQARLPTSASSGVGSPFPTSSVQIARSTPVERHRLKSRASQKAPSANQMDRESLARFPRWSRGPTGKKFSVGRVKVSRPMGSETSPQLYPSFNFARLPPASLGSGATIQYLA